MAIRIVEFFGYEPSDPSNTARQFRASETCPFIQDYCTKTLGHGDLRVRSGACTIRQARDPRPIITCPNRLYANDYRILRDVAEIAFGPRAQIITSADLHLLRHTEVPVVAFGQRWGKELRLPRRMGRGGYFVDWILAHVSSEGELIDFVALEVQTIDTTGNYRAQRDAYVNGLPFDGYSDGGMNWENVNKRILPQLIYKGHVLRREPLCTKGLFFICPRPVYERLQDRLGGDLLAYPNLQPGTITFLVYDLGRPVPPGNIRELVQVDHFTTTVDQVALAFTAPRNLPPPRVYEQAIRAALSE